MKKILTISIWTILLAGTAVLLGFVNIEEQKTVCSNIIATITRQGEATLITREELIMLIQQNNKPLKGRLIETINPRSLESTLKRNPFIQNADVYTMLNGTIVINAIQKDPVLRIFNSHDEQFYIDRNGIIFQTSKDHPARILVATGNINAKFKPEFNVNSIADSLKPKSVLYGLYRLALTARKLEYIQLLAGQINVNQNFEFELFTNTGNHTIIVGDAVNLEQKFNRLYWFYKKAISQVGWERYSTINLKYDNQVVCTLK
jgi:cell division protein FtsQ